MCGLKCNYMYLETGPFLLQYLWMMIIMSRTMGHFLQRCLQKKNANKFNFFLCRAETSATNSVHWRRAFWLGNASSRPDTARRQHWQLPPCPLVIALVTLKCSDRIVRFPQRVPFTNEKMPWCHCPFKNKAYRPGLLSAHQIRVLRQDLNSPEHHTLSIAGMFTLLNELLRPSTGMHIDHTHRGRSSPPLLPINLIANTRYAHIRRWMRCS